MMVVPKRIMTVLKDTEASTDNVRKELPFLKRAFEIIFEKESCVLSYEEIYRKAYAIAWHKLGAELYSGLRESMTEHLSKVRTKLLESPRNSFLKTLIKDWNDYQYSLSTIENVLVCVDRAYACRNNGENVHDLGIITFRGQVVRNAFVGENMRNIVLGMIRRERMGEKIDTISIKHVCEMLITLGIDSTRVYEEDFEKPFLIQTSEFYRREGLKLLEERNVPFYIEKTIEILNEETERAKRYLHRSTEKRVVEVIQSELICKFMRTLLEMEGSGISYMLRKERVDDLGSMYKFLRNIPYGIETLYDCVSVNLRERGKALVVDHEGNTNHPITLITNLLELKDDFDQFLFHSFCADRYFKKIIIDGDFEYILNLNPNVPEYLSLYIDACLKNLIREETGHAAEQCLDKALDLVNYLEEKDVFERVYVRHVAKRLLLNTSFSYDEEENIISKLRRKCGCQFPSQLKVMFQDVSVSRALATDFKDWVQSSLINKDNIDLRVLTVRSGLWPLQTYNTKCNIPVAPRNAFETYANFYVTKYLDRHLTLQPQLGTVDLVAQFYVVPKQDTESAELSPKISLSVRKNICSPCTYILKVSTYQMCVLMLFNATDQLTYEQISSQTNIPEKDLTRTLQLLTMGKRTQRVLIKKPKTGGIDPSYQFQINDSFASKYTVVRVPLRIKNVIETDKQKVRCMINKERKRLIEAAIMRTMKVRKRMLHNALIADVTGQLKPRFSPSSVIIKEILESLVEEQYLTTDKENAKVYTYVRSRHDS